MPLLPSTWTPLPATASWLLMFATLFASTGQAHAEVVTRTFTATVDQIVGDGNQLTSVGGVSLGDTLTGTFRFDPDLASSDLDTADPSRGFYNLTFGSGLVLDYEVAGLSFPGGSFGSFDVRNDVISSLSNSTDVLFVSSGSNGFPTGWNATQQFIDLAAADGSGQVFSDDSFINGFQFSDYDVAFANIYLNGSVNVEGQSFTNLQIGTTVNATAIPEPHTLTLLALLTGGVLTVRRPRRRIAAIDR